MPVVVPSSGQYVVHLPTRAIGRVVRVYGLETSPGRVAGYTVHLEGGVSVSVALDGARAFELISEAEHAIAMQLRRTVAPAIVTARRVLVDAQQSGRVSPEHAALILAAVLNVGG